MAIFQPAGNRKTKNAKVNNYMQQHSSTNI